MKKKPRAEFTLLDCCLIKVKPSNLSMRVRHTVALFSWESTSIFYWKETFKVREVILRIYTTHKCGALGKAPHFCGRACHLQCGILILAPPASPWCHLSQLCSVPCVEVFKGNHYNLAMPSPVFLSESSLLAFTLQFHPWSILLITNNHNNLSPRGKAFLQSPERTSPLREIKTLITSVDYIILCMLPGEMKHRCPLAGTELKYARNTGQRKWEAGRLGSLQLWIWWGIYLPTTVTYWVTYDLTLNTSGTATTRFICKVIKKERVKFSSWAWE